jgi:hypothetical protein
MVKATCCGWSCCAVNYYAPPPRGQPLRRWRCGVCGSMLRQYAAGDNRRTPLFVSAEREPEPARPTSPPVNADPPPAPPAQLGLFDSTRDERRGRYA